jgi:hypothetical protein
MIEYGYLWTNVNTGDTEVSSDEYDHHGDALWHVEPLVRKADADALVHQVQGLQAALTAAQEQIEGTPAVYRKLPGYDGSIYALYGSSSVRYADAVEEKFKELEADSEKKEEELNCCEAVLDAFAAELPEEGFNSGFDCTGDYITAVVNGFKSKAASLQAKLDAATAQMEKQKDEWLAWEGKRADLEACADKVPQLTLSLNLFQSAQQWYSGSLEVLHPLRFHLNRVCESPYRKDYVEDAKIAGAKAEAYFCLNPNKEES